MDKGCTKAFWLWGKRDAGGDINSEMFGWVLAPQIIAFKSILQQLFK